MAKNEETNERTMPQRTQPTHATHMPPSPPRRRPTTDQDDDESTGMRDIGASAAGTASEWASDARDAVSYAARRAEQRVGPMTKSIRRNPWPAMLIGAGLTWMVVEGMRDRGMLRSSSSPRREQDDPADVEPRRRVGMAQRVQDNLRRVVRQRPILAGATAAGIGVVVSLALPETDRENGLLGETRDALVDRAKQAARGTVEAAHGVADGVQHLTGRRS